MEQEMQMEPIRFMPNEAAHGDFLVAAHDDPELRRKMFELGARAVEKSGYTAYLWGLPDKPIVFSGIGVIDGRLVIGPTFLESQPSNQSAGTYVILELGDREARISADPMGMNVVYVGQGIATNRLHLAAIAIKKLDVWSAFATTYADHMFCQQFGVLDTPVRGVSILMRHQRVEVCHAVKITEFVNEKEQFQTVGPSEYQRLIRKGAEEIVNNVEAILKSGHSITCDISGGRDSRIVFAALVALGRTKDVTFYTKPLASSGPLGDAEIGTGLVKKFGGSYAPTIRPVDYEQVSRSHLSMLRRSHIFGAYHSIISGHYRTVYPVTDRIGIRLLGGCGELYRDYYQSFFTSISPSTDYDDSVLFKMLNSHGGPIGGKFTEGLAQHYAKTFTDLPGHTISHKLDSHYLNYRNRYHFGIRETRRHQYNAISPAASQYLLHAARALPASEKATGRVLFDVTQALCEEVAYLPYDKPNQFDFSASDYHRRSRFDGAPLPLEPGMDLLKTSIYRKHTELKRPAEPDFSLENELWIMANENFKFLSSGTTPFKNICSSDLMDHLHHARSKNPLRLAAWASRLQAFSDYSKELIC